MMRAGLQVIAAAVTVAVLAGCSDTGGERARTVDDAAAVSNVGQAPLRTLTVEQARNALLVAADLPTGWTAEPDDGSPKKDSSGDNDPCPAYAAVTQKVSQADDVSTDLTAPDGSEVSEALVAMAETDAKALFAEYSAAVTACKTLPVVPDDSVPFEIKFLALSFPQLADETFAFRATATVLSRTVNIDTVIVRRGGVLGFIVSKPGETIDTVQTEDVARRAVTKVDAALA
jgi:hypothetical protein